MTADLGLRDTVPLRPLTLVDDGLDDCIVSDPETGTSITIPAVGGVVIRSLQTGATIQEATAEAERHAGEPVDVLAFIDALRDLRFIRDWNAGATPTGDTAPCPTAPIQQRRWIGGPNFLRARPLFSRPAWIIYVAALVFSLGCFAWDPTLFPTPQNAFITGGPGPYVLILFPFRMASGALHECWHWLAARAAGVPARFGIDRRLCFLVFETDLSQLWTLPRGKRYGPQFAGLAIDILLLGMLLAFRVTARGHHVAPFLMALAAAMTLVQVLGVLWQAMVSLRTDLYGILMTYTGCYNLWEVKTLLLRRAFGRLTPQQTDAIANAHPRDLAVARWFRWVYLIGVPLAIAYYASFVIPILLATARWAIAGLATTPAAPHFWTVLLTAAAEYIPLTLVVIIWCKERIQRGAAGYLMPSVDQALNQEGQTDTNLPAASSHRRARSESAEALIIRTHRQAALFRRGVM